MNSKPYITPLQFLALREMRRGGKLEFNVSENYAHVIGKEIIHLRPCSVKSLIREGLVVLTNGEYKIKKK